MASQKITFELEQALFDWVRSGAAEAQTTVEQFVASLVRDERQRRALDSMAAWVREDEAGPTNEEMDRIREEMLLDEKPER